MAKSSNPKRGFTLVEVMVAITIVNVMVALFGRMFVAHNRLVNSLEEWCADDPIYYLQPNADPLARSVAVLADLPREVPPPPDAVSNVWPNDVAVTKLELELNQMTSRAYVSVTKAKKN